MFATIVGPYPRPPGLDDAAARSVALEDQLAADMGILADGLPTPAADPLAAWQAADAEARSVAAERDVAERPVKARLLGPFSTAMASGGGSQARRTRAIRSADDGRAAVLALFAAGAPIVQVEEDGLTGIGPHDDAARALAIDAFVRLMDGVEGHVTLSIVGGDPSGAGAEVCYAVPFSSHCFDLVLGPDGWRVARQAPGERGLIVGVADCRTTRRDPEPVLVWGARYAASMHGRGLDRVGLAPSAGLERLSREAALAKITALAKAAATAALRGEALRRALPRPAIGGSTRRPAPAPDREAG